ncbi:MAG: magnesium/cobalt transporter CorA [Thermoanaerobaculia bacterium]|nr:magnesium/cobalt transporter CorA [Thermoanaerobaculia bacterium]
MIVDCAAYLDGRRVSDTSDPAEAWRVAQENENAFVWIGLHEPNDKEFEEVRRIFSLHELAVEDAIHAHQRPKLEYYGDTLFLVLKTLRYVDSEEVIEAGEILIFFARKFIIVVRHGQASQLSSVRAMLDQSPDLLELGPAAVMHAIVDRVIDDYQPVIAGVAQDIDELEEQVFSIEKEENTAARIYYLKREVLEFHRATAPLVNPLNHLSTQSTPLIPSAVRNYFRDVYDHVLRINEKVDSFRDLLTSILEAHLAQLSIRQNEDMRKISAWVAIAVVPTMIAGIYGMNFEHMPILETSWGYPIVMGATALACIGLFFFFRDRGWL